MRKYGRIDYNQPELVELFKRLGCSVFSMASLGDGYADLAVGHAGVNYFFEVKDGSKPPSKRVLTPKERKFHDTWQGQIDIIENPDDVYKWMRNKFA